MANKLKNIHPGEILFEEFLEPMAISQNKIAREIKVPPRRINEIIHGKRSITSDTALRLDKFFGLSEGYWLGMQTDYDLAETKHKIASELKKINTFKFSKNQIYSN
ncbi:MAG TPA: addiction module antidote protein, HigA family [Alphaproteobacteria bacterium]|nr:addiction module antidote protein, HigA family [Alphaproteobacteria bacterium]